MRCRCVFRLFILGIATLIVPAAAAGQSVRVAVMPFQIFAAEDYASLQKGIMDMLTARLTLPGQVTVIDPLTTAMAAEQSRNLTGDSLAKSVGAELKADYILSGSMTVFGKSVSIDAKMISVTGAERPMTFFKQAQGLGQVIPQIDSLARDIENQVFHLTPAGQAPGSVTASEASQKPPEKKKTLDVHAHPEKLLEELRSVSDED